MDCNVKTLWIWDTLPQKTIKSEEQTWLKEGDAVENAHRLKLGKIMCILIYHFGIVNMNHIYCMYCE